MPKTLVIAEKPSVGQDLARVLPGPFEKRTGAGEKTARSLEGPDHVITWAVGHLVQLAEPDERSEKRMKVVKDLLKRDDIDRVINACDSGREGELIFTSLYEYVKSDKPVR